MLIPFGILSSAGGVGVAGDYELLGTEILSATTPEVVFDVSTLASTYKHLQLRISSRLVLGGNGALPVALRFNSDTGNNYVRHFMSANGTTILNGANTSTSFAFAGTVLTTAEVGFAGAVTEILDPFSTSKNTTVRSFSGVPGETNKFVSLLSSAYLDTSAITSISLFESEARSFEIGSRFSLYGIKG